MPLLGLLLLGLGGMGCESRDTTAPVNVQLTGGVTAGERVTGRRTLRATAQDDSGTVAKMEFYLSDSLACEDTDAKDSGATFSCSWDASTAPQGDHPLTVKASDAAGNSTRSEPLSLTIPAPNRAPTLQQVTVTRAALDEGSATPLQAVASDPDGDPLTYAWTQSPTTPVGSFDPPNGANPTWKAPILSRDTTFTLKVTVSDARGGSAQGTVEVKVANVPALNTPPLVDEAITTPTTKTIAGDTVSLYIGARDPDGDPLTYTWTTEPPGQGVFVNSTSAAAQWRSSDIREATFFTFQVTVSDGSDSETRTVKVPLEVPSYAQDIQPIWSPTCTDCHNDSPGTFGELNLQEGSSYAALVNQHSVGGCSPLERVKPGQPDDSVLVQRISGTACGSRMPPHDSGYFDRNPGELIRIRSWILAGAPDN